MIASAHNLILILAAVGVSVSSCCREAPAQSDNIKIKQSQEAIWDFPGAQIVGGRVVAAVDVRPKLDRIETTIKVETVVEYKFGELRARRLPSYERVTLDEISKGVFKFKPSAPEGSYLLEYTAFDPEKGVASNEATVVLERPKPDQPQPNPLPDPGQLTDVDRIVNASIFELRKGFGQAFTRTAEGITAGTIKSDADLQKYLFGLTKAAREQSMVGIDGLIQDKLPRNGSQLLPESSAFIRGIGQAFEKGNR